MKNLIFLLFVLPIFCFGQASIPGCYNYVAQTPITATSNTIISGFSINCNGAATVGITIPAGVHDVHITKCKVFNSTTANGLISIGAGCYNINIDTCFFQSGWRGIYAVGATNNIHISNNYFYNIIDPNVTATASPDGGGASVQLNACTGTSIQILDNRSFHDVSGAGIGDQFSLYKCNGTAASPIRVCRNQALNGSTNPPNTGYAGAVGGDGGGSYQRLDSNIFVNTGAVGAQIQGGHDIEMSYNTIYIAQASYTSVGIAFGNYSGLPSSNITIAYNNTRCIQPSGSVFNYWFDPKNAFSPTGWSTNTTNTGLNANILPNPLWSACNITVLAPNISYSPATYTFTMGAAITPFTPTNTGSIAAFTGALPAGLIINPSTGTISGTPIIGSAPANYTITAINTSGSSTATINIGVISTDASLTTMTLSSGILSPVFCGCTSNYTVSLPNSTTSITLTPTVNQVNATVTVNGIPVTSGLASGAINLTAGANTINVVVTAQNGSTNTYVVIVTRAPATDATLSGLALSSGTLAPVFASGTTNYTTSVASAITSITLTPSVNQANATVTVNGTPVTPGNASGPINLAVGGNIITTVVTAQDGITTKTYTVTVTKPPATDATLSALALSSGTLAPAFDGATTSYTANVGNNTPSVTLTPTVNQANATVMVNGIPVTSGNASGPINLAVGDNIINTVVTAQDGSTNKTYTVTVTRAPAIDATLSSLAISSGTLSPSFDKGTTSYTANVGNNTASVTLTPTASQANAAVTVNGNLVTSGNASGPINLNVGDNVITTIVTVQNVITTYNVTVKRAAATDATLSSLAISGGTMTPVFDGGTTSYAAGVDNSTAFITLTPTVNQANATVTVNGTPVTSGNSSNPVNLAVGNNNITTVVTAQDGTTKKTYTLAVTRAAATNTITFNPLTNVTYGDSPVALSASSDNTDAGATITFTSDNPLVATVSGNTVTIVGAGTANITARQAATANFNAATDVSQALTVSKANLTITANGQSKFYGFPFTFSGTEFTLQGLLNSDAVNQVTLTSGGTGVSANPGPYPIVTSAATGSGLSNYNISYVPGTLTVNGITLNFDPIPSKIYATADFSPGATSNTAITYTSSNPNVATIVSGNIHIRGAGTSVITSFSGAVSQTQTLTVTPAPLTITANNVNKTYGAALSGGSGSTAFSASGLQNGETIGSVTITYDTGAPANAQAATYTGSVIPSAAASGTFNPANYSITYSPGDIIVGQATIDITAKNAVKVYGELQTFTGTEFTITGLKNGDAVASVTLVSDGTPATAEVNHYDIIPSAAVGASGTDLSNYNIIYHNGTDVISKGSLTITANNASKVYGITQSFQGTEFTIVGLQNADHVDFVTLTSAGTPASAHANNYPIIPSVAVPRNGTSLANYDINYENGDDAVGTALLTITADDQSIAFGDPPPTLTASYSGFVNGESSASLTTLPALTTIATAGSPVGNYLINVSGAIDNNYAFSYVPGNLSINALPFTFNNIPSKVYGAADFDPGAISSSVISYTSSNTAVATIVSGNIHIVGAGSTTITADDGSNQFSRTLTVTPAALSITANNQSKIYGTDNPLLTLNYNGFVNGDTPASLSTLPSAITIANTSSSTGTYPIIVNGAESSNYNISYTAGTLTVTPAALSITADNQSKAYGATNPVLTVSYSGFVNGDTPSDLNSQPTVTTTATTNSTVGSYPITVTGAADPNYTISYVQGILTVTGTALSFGPLPSKTYGNTDFNPGAGSSSSITYTSSNTAVATIVGGNIHIVGAGTSTITANDGIASLNQVLTVTAPALNIAADNQSKTYGAANPALTVSYSGFVNGDTQASLTIAPVVSTTATASSAVGNYPITVTGAVSANYNITYTANTLGVGKAALTITANNQNKTQGAVNPALTVSYSGFMNAETNAVLTTQPTVTTTAVTGSPVGTYPITASGAAAANYSISYVQGTLTVSGAALAFGPIPSKAYGAADFNAGATSSSSITYTSGNPAVATVVSGNIHIVGAGTSTITANDGTSNLNQTLTVTPAALAITASNQSKTYGAANPVLTLSYSGFVNGDTQASLTTAPTVTTTAVTGSPAGTYPITASGAASANYSISYTAGTLTVGQVALTITANNQSKTQGAVNPTLTVSYSGFVNGDTQANLTTQPTVTTTAVTGSPVGTYPITASGAAGVNYSISYVPGTLTVTGASLTFGPIPSKVYGTADFSPGATGGTITYTSSNTAVATIVSGNIHILSVGTSTITANNGSTSLQQTLTVTPAALSITANNVNKTYGATLTGGAGSAAFTSAGLVNGQTIGSVTIAYGTGSAATAAVATYTGSVTPSAATGGTFAAANYTITYNTGNIVVGQAALSITANNVNKTYGAILTGGAGSAAFTSAGLVNGQTIGSVTIAYGTGSAATAAVATYTGSVTPSAATGGTFAAANYTITYNTGNIVVGQAPLTITANNQTKVQGAVNPALTVSYSGFVNGQTNTILTTQPTVTTTAVTGSPVGTYPITASGAAAANYSISYVPGTLTVTGASLTFGPIPSKVYGAADFNPGATGGTITYTSSNTAVATIVSGNIHIVSVGTSTITANNGTTSLQQTLTVTPAALSITANNVNKTYGAALTGGAGSAAFTSTGLVNGQTIGSVTIAYGTGSAATAAVATYTGSVTPSAATGGTFAAGNYTITYNTGNIVVGRAPLTITANNQTKVQGAANPALTVSYSGFVNGQTNAVLTTQPTVTTTAVTGSPAGTYPITASGAAAANYTISYVPGTLTVTAASTLTFAPIPSKVYGAANFSPGATTTTGTITYTSNNTAVATIVSGNIHIVGVGTSTITASNGTSSLQQTLTVTKAPLSILAYNINKTYGSTLTNGAGLTYFTPTGLQYGQTIGTVTITFGTGATATSAVGTYTGSVVASAATGGTFTPANYTIVYASGNIIVNKASLSITANNVTKTYGTTITGGSGSKAFTTTGLQNGQTISSVTIAYGTGAAATANAGTYSGTVTPSAATGGTFIAADYTITYVSRNITVGQAALRITANNQTKVRGSANPTLTVSYTGFVNGQSNSVLTTQPRVTTTATTSSPAGTYPITVSGAVGANYAITYVAGTLTVTASAGTLMVNASEISLMSVNSQDVPSIATTEPVVKQAVSPNGDGINDVLVIENIESYPDNRVVLMNRNGNAIYEINGYDNSNKVFDGHSNITRAMEPPGTYYYMLEYKVKGVLRHKTDFFVIKY